MEVRWEETKRGVSRYIWTPMVIVEEYLGNAEEDGWPRNDVTLAVNSRGCPMGKFCQVWSVWSVWLGTYQVSCGHMILSALLPDTYYYLPTTSLDTLSIPIIAAHID